MSRSANVQAVVTALTAEGLVVSSREADDGQSTMVVGIGDEQGEVFMFFIHDEGIRSEVRRAVLGSGDPAEDRGIFYLGDVTVADAREIVSGKMAPDWEEYHG